MYAVFKRSPNIRFHFILPLSFYDPLRPSLPVFHQRNKIESRKSIQSKVFLRVALKALEQRPTDFSQREPKETLRASLTGGETLLKSMRIISKDCLKNNNNNPKYARELYWKNAKITYKIFFIIIIEKRRIIYTVIMEKNSDQWEWWCVPRRWKRQTKLESLRSGRRAGREGETRPTF